MGIDDYWLAHFILSLANSKLFWINLDEKCRISLKQDLTELTSRSTFQTFWNLGEIPYKLR